MDEIERFQKKMENPKKLEELAPQKTLIKSGLKESDIVCDIGAGTGVFTLPAARITNNIVYALDNNAQYLKIIEDKAQKEKLFNIKIVEVTGDNFHILNSTIDFVILSTVLHEVDNKEILLTEIKKIMKPQATLLIVEFIKFDELASFGPSNLIRIDKKETIEICRNIGFNIINDFNLGSNFYCIVLSK